MHANVYRGLLLYYWANKMMMMMIIRTYNLKTENREKLVLHVDRLKALTLLQSVASGRLFQIRRDCVGISSRERCGAQTQQTYSVLGYL